MRDNNFLLLLAGAGLLGLAFYVQARNKQKGSYRTMTPTTPHKDYGKTLAERNNNPLNIRFNPKNQWRGMEGSNQGFVVFSSPDYGYRAAFILIHNYVQKGHNTLKEIISRWAPPSENDTQAYIDFVSEQTGLWPETFVTENDYFNIVRAMAKMEGAPDNTVNLNAGYELAKGRWRA